MKKVTLTLGMSILLILVQTCQSLAGNEGTWEEALRNGTPSLELRLGFEHSSTDDGTNPATGLTLPRYVDIDLIPVFAAVAAERLSGVGIGAFGGIKKMITHEYLGLKNGCTNLSVNIFETSQ